jgi:hypothetical protein
MDAGIPLHAAPQQMLNEREVVRHAGRQAIRQFLESHTCFSVLRASGKLVVFDTRIPIQLAFYALVEHGECVCVVVRERRGYPKRRKLFG